MRTRILRGAIIPLLSVTIFLCHCKPEVVNAQLPCILPVNYHEDPIKNEIVNAMNSSVLHKTQTTTITVSTNVTSFTVEYDLAVFHHHSHVKISDLDIIAYINDSDIIPNIPFLTCPEKQIKGNVLSRTCVFNNAPLYPSNNTKVQFRLVYKNTIQVCQPESFLFIEEKPSPVPLLNYMVDTVTCKGISLTFPYVPSDTHVTCTIYNSDDELVYNNIDCDNSTIIPATVFSNHTGHYTIVTESVKTVARGEKRNETIVLKKENIRYNVTMIGIEVLSDEFYARFLLEMYQKCSLSQPNYIIISSNTSDSKQYNITGTTLGNTLEIKHKIYPYMKHHTFTIEDSSGKIINRTTNKSSFNIQEFNHKEVPGSLVATFGFTPGSTLKELILNITGNHSNKNTKINVTRPSGSDSLILTEKISPFPAGVYDIQVIERGNKTVFDIHVSIPSPSVTTVTINATVTKKVKESLETNKNHESVIGLVIVLVFILVGALIIIVGLIYTLYRVKKSSRYYMCPEDNLLIAVQIIRNELLPDNRNHGLDGAVANDNDNGHEAEPLQETEIRLNDHLQTPPDLDQPQESTGIITSDMMVASVQPTPSVNSDQVRFSSLNTIAEDLSGVQVDTEGKSEIHIPLPSLHPKEVRNQQSEQSQPLSISSQLKLSVDSKSTSLVDKSNPFLEGQDESKEPSHQMDGYINEPLDGDSINNSKGITSTSNPSEYTEGSRLLHAD